MRSHEQVELLPPVGGKRNNSGYQSKAPYYSEDLLNVRPFDTLEGRGRLGSRPGLAKAFQQRLGTRLTGTTGDITGGPGTTFSDGLTNFVTAGVVAGVDVLEITDGTDVTPGTYTITAVAALSLTVSPSPGVGASGIVYTIGYFPIRLASVIRTFNSTGSSMFQDDFSGTALSASWSFPSWTINSILTAGSPVIASGYAATSAIELRSAALADQSISTTAFRQVSLEFTPNDNTRAYVLMDMNSATPVPAASVMLEAVNDSSGKTLNLYINGTLVTNVNTGGPFDTYRVVRLSIDTSNTIRCYWQYDSVPGITYDASAVSYSPAGGRVGFALRRSSSLDAIAPSFSFAFTSSSGGTPPEAAVFSANGQLYRESISGTLAAVSHPTLDLTSERRIYAAARLQNLYIADYDIRRERTTKSTAATVEAVSASQARLDDTAVTDWTALGIDIDGDVLEILDTTTTTSPTVGTPSVGIYNIASIHATNGLTFDRSNAWLAESSGGGAIAYRVVRYSKTYNSTATTLTRTTIGTLGTTQFPAGCRSIALWSDRIVICNDANTPHGWWMSKVGDPTDWTFGGTAITSAVNGTASEYAGLIGEPLVTTIPYSDDYLIFAGRTSFYVLRGNPRLNGQLDNISREIGIVGIGAWCRTPEGRLIVLTPDGLYEIRIQDMRAVSMSRESIPAELLGLTDDLYEVSLAYDVERRGVLISATSLVMATPSVHYFYDERLGGYFPQSFDADHDPNSVVSYQPGGVSMPTVLWGCHDGYVRKFEDSAHDDDGTDFSSYVYYGPVRLGATDLEDGMLHEIVAVMDANSGATTLAVQTGHSAQVAKNRTARFSTTLAAGRNRNRYPRLRGSVMYVKLSGTAGTRWVNESLTISRERLGRLVIT